MFEENKFICVFNNTDTNPDTPKIIRICIFFCIHIDFCNCNETYCEDHTYDNSNFFSEGIIYDTSNTTIKVISAKYSSENLLSWINIFIDPIANRFTWNEKYFELPTDYNFLSCDTKDCDFNQFYSEYLLCCACLNYIICTRLSNNFQKINYFKLMINGGNSNVKIIDNGNYVSIFL